ncbi:TetR/AcrR family transcriptional regulator [Dactylosporangium sp. CA-139066]|uniref:TetR/AcrR family transcriptional regulator n=1 Tax=Dactylosporangium sp. CA-139066 TaxID=3239930 RepID=UPI003D8B3DC4
MARAAREGTTRGTYAPAETRKALLDSALRLFDVRGYHETSVEDIVSEAGVTKGALYHHFSGKEEILQQLQEDYINNRLNNCLRILENHSSAKDRLYHLILESLVAIDQFRSYVTVYVQEKRFLAEERFATIKEKRDQVDAIYESVIRQGMDNGEFDPSLEPRITSFAILGMLAWAYNWYSSSGRLRVEEIAGLLTDLVLRGVGAPPNPGLLPG